MRGSRSGRAGRLGWACLLLCTLALVAIAIPGVGFVRAIDDAGVRLTGSAQHVVLPAARTYGVYVDDADNSGYSESCSATEADGTPIQMKFPPWSMSSSDTEVLDLVFDTGSGDLTLDCDIPGERVTVRAVPNYTAMLLGVMLAGIAGCAGLVLLVGWLIARSSPPHTASPLVDAAGDARP